MDAIAGATDSAERARERIAEEASEALARAGRRPVSSPSWTSKYRRSPAPALKSSTSPCLARWRSSSRVYAPAGLGSHPDHLLTRRYARMLLRGGMPVTLYADLPYCILHGWPGWVDGRDVDPHRDVDPFWLSFLEDVPEMPALRSANVERLDAPAAAAKLEAMRCYRTQFASLSYGAGACSAIPRSTASRCAGS